MFTLPSAVGLSGVQQVQKIRVHLFPRLTKAMVLITLFLSQTPLHSHTHTQSTHSFHLRDTVATFSLISKKKKSVRKCDCKITVLVYPQPGSPLLIFMILRDKVCSSRRRGLIRLSQTLWFPPLVLQ